MFDPEIGFTSDVIRDHSRFVGRSVELRNAIKALNSSLSLIAVYGKRGVGKSSLLRQVQQMALGDYSVAIDAGLFNEIPKRPRTFLTVYYTCDSSIQTARDLVLRLCNDQDSIDGLLRLVPNDGKEIVEFQRTKEVSAGADLKVVNWGTKGVEASKYARVVVGDPVQTFRNFLSSIVQHQVKGRLKRDGLLILLDEFDVIQDKAGLGSLIKSLSSPEIKFGICGIARDLTGLVSDHQSVERLLEEGANNVRPMFPHETARIFSTATNLYKDAVKFEEDVVAEISRQCGGYPYLAQLIGKECVNLLNQVRSTSVDKQLLGMVFNEIKCGRAFPTLESAYQRAVGDAEDRKMLLHLLADQDSEDTLLSDDIGRVFLKKVRADAATMGVQYIDQLLPRLVDKNFGPVLAKVGEKQGVYEFLNPTFKLYVKMRNF